MPSFFPTAAIQEPRDAPVYRSYVSGVATSITATLFLICGNLSSSALITSSAALTADASAAGSDLYDFDAATGDLTDLTPDSTHAGSAGVLGVFGASNDGSYVYFLATGALASGAIAGNDNIFVWHNGTTTFIGALTSDASEIAGNIGGGMGLDWQVSPDGLGFGFLFKGAIGGPQAENAQPYNQAYYYDAGTGTLTCASCLPNAGTPTGPVSFNADDTGAPVLGGMVSGEQFVTDGGRLFFNTPKKLGP